MALYPISMEVQQSDKSWKQFIESFESYFLMCSTGLKEYYFDPGEIVVITVPVFKENEGCRIRFRMMENYSNAIIQNARF